MAALGSYDFRDPNMEDYIRFADKLFEIQKPNTKQQLKILQMECTMPSGATMIAADAGRTDEFDGVATPIIVYADSSHANDNGTTPNVGVRSITVFGIDENDDYVESTILTNGTTKVAGVTTYQRTIAMKAATAGASLTAVGNVRITDTGEADQYLLIPVGQIASAQAGKVYVPVDWKATILEIKVYIVQTPDANKALTTDGVNVWVRWFDGGLTPDEIHQYSVVNIQPPMIIPHWGIFTGADDAYIDIHHQSIDTDITVLRVHYDITYALWKEAS